MQRNRLFLALPAVAALLLTACSADEPMLLSDGEGVTFTAQLPQGLATRFGEGQAVDQLKYAVFHSSNSETSIINSDSEEAPQATRVGDDFKLTLPLLPNETYSIVFWAQSSQSDAFTFDPATGTVKVLYSNMEMNSDNHDVFFAGREHRVGLDKTEITLTRPLAQINIGTDDLAAAKALGAEHANTDIAIAGVHNLLDLKTGVVSKTDDFDGKVTFTAVEPLEADFPVKHADENKSYKFMAMGYVLTGSEEAAARADESPADGALTNIDLTFNYTDANRLPTLRSIPSVPVRRNHRTNLHGSLITTTTDWTISIDAGFATGEDINHKYVEPWDGESAVIPHIDEQGTAEVSTAAEFVGLAKAMTSKDPAVKDLQTIELEKDIDLGGNHFTEFNIDDRNFVVKIDGNDNMLKNFNTSDYMQYGNGMFNKLGPGSEIKNLTIENVRVGTQEAGNCMGILAGYSYGANIENVTIRNCEMYGLGKLGSVIGMCVIGETTTTLKNVTIENVAIYGTYDLGGMVGHVQEKHNIIFDNCPEPDVTFEFYWEGETLGSKCIKFTGGITHYEKMSRKGDLQPITLKPLADTWMYKAKYPAIFDKDNKMTQDNMIWAFSYCAKYYNFLPAFSASETTWLTLDCAPETGDENGDYYYYVGSYPVNEPVNWDACYINQVSPSEKRGR